MGRNIETPLEKYRRKMADLAKRAGAQVKITISKDGRKTVLDFRKHNEEVQSSDN